jgi:hypothetical protein
MFVGVLVNVCQFVRLFSVSGGMIGEKGLVRMKKKAIMAFVCSLMKPTKPLSIFLVRSL